MTQDEIIEMARQAGCFEKHQVLYFTQQDLEHFAKLVAAKEREACAKVLDDIQARCIAKDIDDPPLDIVASAIRARGEA
jgi:hypothetical protein